MFCYLYKSCSWWYCNHIRLIHKSPVHSHKNKFRILYSMFGRWLLEHYHQLDNLKIHILQYMISMCNIIKKLCYFKLNKLIIYTLNTFWATCFIWVLAITLVASRCIPAFRRLVARWCTQLTFIIIDTHCMTILVWILISSKPRFAFTKMPNFKRLHLDKCINMYYVTEVIEILFDLRYTNQWAYHPGWLTQWESGPHLWTPCPSRHSSISSPQLLPVYPTGQWHKFGPIQLPPFLHLCSQMAVRERNIFDCTCRLQLTLIFLFHLEW